MFQYHSFLLYFGALLAGAILPFAFAPHHIWPLAILSPAGLLWVWLNPIVSPKKAWWLGLSYGLGMFGVGISWVFVSIHTFGNTDLPLAVLITGIFVLVLSLFPACQGYCLKRFFKGNRLVFCILGFPSSWVLFEWIRSWFLTGFPWLYLGYTQLDTPIAGFAPLLSVYGASLAVALSSGALLAFFFKNNVQKIYLCGIIVCLWGGGQLLRGQIYTVTNPKPYTASLIQGNIKPFDKFSQADPIGTTERIYGGLSKNQWQHNIILWPESAIPLPLPESQPYIDKLAILANAHHTTLISGIQVINHNKEYHNSLIAIGNGKGIYHKYHLVPFGDFLPFEHWLRGLINFFNLPMSSFTPGPLEQPLITAGDLTLDPLICYEIAFPELVRTTLRNAGAIVTLSEDGWFGGSWGPHQHLEIARMRALETNRYVLRATTSGITAIIDPMGQLAATVPQFIATVLSGSFYSISGETPWVKMGLWPLIILLMGCFILPGRFFLTRRNVS